MGASATVASPGTASSEAVVITRRGPTASMCRPTQMPAPAATSWETEKAPVTAMPDHPVVAVMDPCSAANA